MGNTLEIVPMILPLLRNLNSMSFENSPTIYTSDQERAGGGAEGA